jgi:peroxiredoxin
MKKSRLILMACIACSLLFSCKEVKAPMDDLESMDNRHFELMKQGKYEESLTIALNMEEKARQLGDTLKPWYYLKIADSYNGMKNYKKSIEWISKAVNEKNFNNYKIFQNAKYEYLQSDTAFQKLVCVMKDRIGLNRPAKDFEVSLINGDSFKLSSYLGKVVLIDFWDVRCAPCIKALPELKSLYEQFHGEGFEIIAISLDKDKELLMKFLDKNSLMWPISCSFKGFNHDETALIYGINATPSTWLVDRKGILRFNEIKGDELKAAIELLLKE